MCCEALRYSHMAICFVGEVEITYMSIGWSQDLLTSLASTFIVGLVNVTLPVY